MKIVTNFGRFANDYADINIECTTHCTEVSKQKTESCHKYFFQKIDFVKNLQIYFLSKLNKE